ncbi:GNAT family N-acetyltransferase [Allokutzneria oryzae]|uniref:GNAT family N-acetyltransferase n=1 Tax=Allokutzneria oryzae TaxID=1378989 RepID=A0ABV5ZQG0_9PSEU
MQHSATRIAAAQLSSRRRVRTAVPASPFVGMVCTTGPAFLSSALPAVPGARIDSLGDSLAVLAEAFGETPLRFEIIEESSPGAVEALSAAGVQVAETCPVLTVSTADVVAAQADSDIAVEVVRDGRQLAEARSVATAAFGRVVDGEPLRTDTRDGGRVLVRHKGVAVATAAWSPVVDDIAELVGIGVHPEHQGRGFGALATASAVRASGAELHWLTPADAGADRVYRRVGFRQAATAVHLGPPR